MVPAVPPCAVMVSLVPVARVDPSVTWIVAVPPVEKPMTSPAPSPRISLFTVVSVPLSAIVTTRVALFETNSMFSIRMGFKITTPLGTVSVTRAVPGGGTPTSEIRLSRFAFELALAVSPKI